MTLSERLTEVFRSAKEIPLEDSSKFIFFSDCHRGVNDWADEFADNQSLFFHALGRYYQEGFTYIEVGDGDELWENRAFADVRRAHSHVFWLMRQFYKENRLYLMWGNHDIERQSPEKVRETLYQYVDERTGKVEPLFEGIQVHEGLVLRHSDTGGKIFLVHGHQGDLINDSWWRLGRFFVRHFWRHLQLLGIRDPTRPAENFKRQGEVEQEITEWIVANHQMTICGHTHRSMFPGEGSPPYFNTGSCVHPRCITGIEIQNGEITLIKWWYTPRDADGVMCITKELVVGPQAIRPLLEALMAGGRQDPTSKLGTKSHKKGYVLPTLLGAIAAGLFVALLTKAIPMCKLSSGRGGSWPAASLSSGRRKLRYKRQS